MNMCEIALHPLARRLRLPPRPAAAAGGPAPVESFGCAPSLAELAVAVKMAATAELCGAEALETLPVSQHNLPGFERTLAMLRRQVEELGAAYALLRALIPHEATVRALIAESEERAA